MSYYGVSRWAFRLLGPVCVLLSMPALGSPSPQERAGALLLLTVGLFTAVFALPAFSRGGRAAAQRRVVRLGGQRRPGLLFRRSRSKRALFAVGLGAAVGPGLVLLLFAELLPAGRLGEDAAVRRAIGAAWAVAGALGLLWRFARRDTRGLVLLADGLVLPTDQGRYFVPWENVADVALDESETEHALVVSLDDPARHRPLGRARAAPTAVHLVGLDTLVAPPRLVLAAVRHFWRRPAERQLLGREDAAATLARVEAG